MRRNVPAATVRISTIIALLLAATFSVAQMTVLHTMQGKPDGNQPQGRLVADAAGNFFGTTFLGGAFGRGAIYELPAGGDEKVLYSFTGGSDGAFPMGNLLVDRDGNLFGTTSLGGNLAAICPADNGCGTIFKLTPGGKLITLYTFAGGTDGGIPKAGLIRAPDGTFYGTASVGGSPDGMCSTNSALPGCGVVFKFRLPATYSVVHAFTGVPDGWQPWAPLTNDAAGNLYGTTIWGGSTADGFPCVQDGSMGCGVVFKIDTAGNESVLHAFSGPADGKFPLYGRLTIDGGGNVYGVTSTGGSGGGFGVVFALDPAGNESILYSFTGGADGGTPVGGLFRDARGNLYGTTEAYGGFGGVCGTQGCGVLFKLTPAGHETVLQRFSFKYGAAPNTDLVLYNQELYGTTLFGPRTYGVVFKFKP